jgi:hypothetical protein
LDLGLGLFENSQLVLSITVFLIVVFLCELERLFVHLTHYYALVASIGFYLLGLADGCKVVVAVKGKFTVAQKGSLFQHADYYILDLDLIAPDLFQGIFLLS